MKNIFIATAAAVVCLSANAQPALKIYKGENRTDTVYTDHITVVAVTDPGAEAAINGTPQHVYKTGSFGADILLNLGVNTIEVSATDATGTANRTVTVVREQPAQKAQPAPAHETTTTFATPFYVLSTDGTYMQYGASDDRLGGSKIGFIAADIPLKVVGRVDDLYKVQLAESRYAYVPAKLTAQCNTPAHSVVNSSSWSLTNIGNADKLTVSLPERRPYRYYTLLDPSTIVIELFGVNDNSNWITQRTLDLGIVDYVDFNQPQSDVYQIIIHLKDKYQWGFSVSYEGSSLAVSVRHCPKSLDLRNLTIGLDAGHGGKYLGAVSPSGVLEKDVNLDIVLRLRTLLEKAGAKVVLTRDSDINVDMSDRKKIWRDANVDIAISVHNNSGGSALSSPGTSTYYKHLFDRPLAQALLNRMLETGLPLFGLVGNFNFSLNSPTEFPAVLVEGMFMSSLAEEEHVADPQFRQLVAQKIFAGIKDYLKTVEQSRR